MGDLSPNILVISLNINGLDTPIKKQMLIEKVKTHQQSPDSPVVRAQHFHLWGPGQIPGTPLQYFCLENPTDGGAWQAAVHGVAKSWTRPSDSTFTFHFHALEKEMATHSNVLAWRTPGAGEPGGLPSVGSHRVGHD